MLKLKSLFNIFWIMTILFCCYSIDSLTVYAFNSHKGNENVIVDQCPREDSGQSSGGVSTITGDHNYTSNWKCPENLSLEYDTANSNETINRNGSANLFIIGNDGPYYTWTVSGQGFWFDADYTVKTLTNNGVTATLYADDSACGAATIEITGCNGGNPETGYVRCNANSAWVLFCSAGTYQSCYGMVESESIIGDTKIRSITQCHSYPFENLTSSCGGYTCSYEGLSCVSACPYYNCNLRVYKWECN